ncbi:hypothetical protein D9758_014959 [Tetrapyrgos nigripes]|uniref:MYND-type domain-containing protein n=1 Tax=Tetrapyrgos nigripes TaxID=182062 RepID=A0A8H5CJL1_9AGAR|nr:hypothetical protein D9758_014959 [Tetrapyrgos nigripes]
MCLQQFFVYNVKDKEQILTRTMDSIPTSSTTLLRFLSCSGSVRRQGLATESLLPCLEFALHILTDCCSGSKPFLIRFTADGGIQILTRLLRKLNSQRHVEQHKVAGCDLVERIAAIKWILLCLCGVFEHYGSQAVISALEGRLLMSMIRASRFMEFEEDHEPSDLLDQKLQLTSPMLELYRWIFNAIMVQLVHRKVLNLYVRSFEQINSESEKAGYGIFLQLVGPFKAGTQASKDSVGSKWTELLARSKLIKEKWEKYKEEGIFVCSNPDCSESDDEGLPKRCAKCKSAVYCSKRCQKRDWKFHHHREDCDETIKFVKEAGVPNDTDDLDDDFLHWWVTELVYDNQKRIKEETSKLINDEDNYKQNGHPICFINFRYFPPQVLLVPVYSLVECHQSDPLTFPLTRDTLESILETIEEGHSAIAYAAIPGRVELWQTVVTGVDLSGEGEPEDMQSPEKGGEE